MTIDALAEELRPHYSRFLGSLDGDILLTGHSHQAWPDRTRQAQLDAWDDAASLIDGKWSKIFSEVLPTFQSGVAKRIGSSRPSDIALAPNTHELGYRLLSCFSPRVNVVTSDAEFHSLSRQLRRLEEDGAQVTRVESGDGLVERMIEVLREDTDLVALSQVLFTTSEIQTELGDLLRAADAKNIPVLVDAYHAFNTVEMNVDAWPGNVFVTGGGYKYAQSGEGVCWLLLPEDASRFRPRQTGWFADFGALEGGAAEVGYGPGGQRFFGATFDSTSLYRANAAMAFLDDVGLDVPRLRAQSLLQTGLIIELFDTLKLAAKGFSLATPKEDAKRAAFVSLTHPKAVEICAELATKGVRTDARAPYLRFGPAPYTTRDEIERAMKTVAEL